LLSDGNVLIDTGIDAVQNAELTYRKIESADTSAVVCVQPASAGDMTKEETELLEKISSGIAIASLRLQPHRRNLVQQPAQTKRR